MDNMQDGENLQQLPIHDVNNNT